jgi:excisionase family DNA binding protein
MTRTPKTDPAPTSTFLTVDEVALQLRVDAVTVRRWINDRQLPAVRLGHAFRIAERDLAQFLGNRRTVADA